MKKSFKSLLALALVCVIALGCAGCTKKASNDGEIPTLVWYVPGDKQADIATVMEEVNKITVEKIGAKVDLQFIEQAAFTERMQMAMSSKKEFDLTLTGYVNPFLNGVTKGGLLDITEYIEKDKELKAMLPQHAWDSASYDGSIYAVPNEQIWASAHGYAFRKDLVEKYNFDVSKVKTPDDATEFFDLVLKNDPQLIPVYFNTGYNLWYLNDYERVDLTASAALNRKTLKIEPFTAGKAMKDASYKKHEWYKKGYIREDIATAQNEMADMKAGRYACMITNITKPGYELTLKKSYGFDFEIVPFQTPYITKSSIQATMTAVSATTKHPEKCVELIKLMNTDKDLYNLIVWGIEGKHYEFVDKDKDIIKCIEDSGYKPANGWKFGNQFKSYIEEGENPDIWKLTKEYNDAAEVSPLCSISFVNDNIETELAQIDTVNSKYPFHRGYIDPAKEWDNYVKEVKVSGADEIVKEYQKQYKEQTKKKK